MHYDRKNLNTNRVTCISLLRNPFIDSQLERRGFIFLKVNTFTIFKVRYFSFNICPSFLCMKEKIIVFENKTFVELYLFVDLKSFDYNRKVVLRFFQEGLKQHQRMKRHYIILISSRNKRKFVLKKPTKKRERERK